jgi:hypothetical protein
VNSTILALNLGNYKSVACLYDTKSGSALSAFPADERVLEFRQPSPPLETPMKWIVILLVVVIVFVVLWNTGTSAVPRPWYVEWIGYFTR